MDDQTQRRVIWAAAGILLVLGGGSFIVTGLTARADEFDSHVPDSEYWPVVISSYVALLSVYICAVVYAARGLEVALDYPSKGSFCGRSDLRDCCGVGIRTSNIVLLVLLGVLFVMWMSLAAGVSFSGRFIQHLLFTVLAAVFSSFSIARLSRAYSIYGPPNRTFLPKGQQGQQWADIQVARVAAPA